MDAGLLKILQGPGSRAPKPKSQHPVSELDTESDIALAIDYLEREKPAIEGDAGDPWTVHVGRQLRDRGLSESTALDLMLDHWNDRCSPPWLPDDLAVKVANAFKYAKGAQGARSITAQFEPVDPEVLEILEPEKNARRLYSVSFKDAVATALDQMGRPLVEGLLDQETMAVLYGDSNTGKTFLMLDIAFHIAAGLPWAGRNVAQGLVVYLAAEGGRGIFRRVRALAQRYNAHDVPLVLVPCPVNLLTGKTDAKAIIDLVKAAEVATGQPCRLLVVDTLARALDGGDENTSTDMGSFIKNADRIRAAIKATLAVVHHSGKDATKGARGWSGLRAATDTELETVNGVLRTRKQRDMEFAKDIQFALEHLVIGADADGRQVTSSVVRVMSGSEFTEVELDPNAQEMLDAFEVVAKDKAATGGGDWQEQIVDREEWEQEYLSARKARADRGELNQKYASGSAPVVAPGARRMRDLRNQVVQSGSIEHVSRNQWVSSKRKHAEACGSMNGSIQPNPNGSAEA